MHAALKKLLYRGQDPILVTNAPARYSPFLEGLSCRIDTRPRKTSKSYTSDLSRETIWVMVQERGIEGVAMVVINDDWSAFRVRAAVIVKKAHRV